MQPRGRKEWEDAKYKRTKESRKRRSVQIAKISDSKAAYIVLAGKYILENHLEVLGVNEMIFLNCNERNNVKTCRMPGWVRDFPFSKSPDIM